MLDPVAVPAGRPRVPGAGGSRRDPCGWPGEGPLPVRGGYADVTMVTYRPRSTGHPLPLGFEITGPVFPNGGWAGYMGDGELDAKIVAALRRDGRPAVLLTMGSSGTAALLLEAIRACAANPSRLRS